MPGSMPMGSMMPASMGKGMGKGTMPLDLPTPPGTRKMMPGEIGQGLHHGFGHADSFAHPEVSKHTTAMMKHVDHNTVGNHPLGIEKAPRMWIKFGEFSPVYPTPETPQYGYVGNEAMEREEKIQEMFCSKLEDFSSWGRANLRGICDKATLTWKQKLANPWQWTFIHADGWNLNFWPEDFHKAKDTDSKDDGSVRPIASIDIRQILAANYEREASSAEGTKAPFEVHMNFQNGYFPFRVVDERDAQAWCVRVMKGVVETVKVQQLREKYVHQLHKMHEIEVEGHRIERDPVRSAKVRRIWQESVDCVERGSRPSMQTFIQMYNLYDSLDSKENEHGEPLEDGEATGGDGNLTMHEIEVMCREFLDMKYYEVQAIVVRQEKELFHRSRPVSHSHEHKLRWTIEQGRELMEHYDRQRDPKDFFDRVVNFHHRTDISREGRVDVAEFCNAAPIFLMPMIELRKEGLFFSAAEHSDSQVHRAREHEDAKLRAHGKTREQQAAECNQQ